ncbi:MAG: PQQ-binding-like beta-propeller repeat protein [Planctomycetota bacterium]
MEGFIRGRLVERAALAGEEHRVEGGWRGFARAHGRVLSVAAAVALVISLSACAGGTPQGNTDDGMAHMAVGDAGMVEIKDDRLEEVQFRSLWTSRLRARVEQAWFLGENLYVTTSSANRFNLVKINGESGFVDWTYPLDGKLDYAPGVYIYPKEQRATRGAEVFIVQRDVVHCIDDQFGAESYRIETGFPVSTSVTAAPDHFFVGSWNHRMYCFSKLKRFEEWSYITDATITAPATVGGVNVYFGSEDSNLYCLNIGAGYQEGKSWTRSTGGKIVAPPVFYSNRVYFGSWDYKVYCLDEYQGLLRWSYPAEAPISEPIFVQGDSILAVAHEEARGKSSWRLVSLNRGTGARRWEREGVQRVLSADAFHCFALDVKNGIQALRLDDGVASWRLDVQQFAFVLGQDADQGRSRERIGRIYLVTDDGNVQAIQPRR